MHHLPIVIVVIVSTSIAVFVTLGTLSHKDGDGKHGKCAEEMRQLMTCCPLPVKDDMTGSKCKMDSDDHESMRGRCKYFECVFKEKGFMNEAGELNKETMMKSTEEYLKDQPEFQKIAKESVEKAFEEAIKHNKGDNKDDNKKCNKTAMAYVFRSINHIVRNCPASKWTNSQQCNDLKASDTCSKKNSSD